MNGNRFGYCILHKLDHGIDTGEILFKKEFLFSNSCRIPNDFIKEYIDHNIDFILNIIDKTNEKAVYCFGKKNEFFSTYWPRLNTQINGWID